MGWREPLASATAGDALAGGAAAEADEPTKTGPSGGGTRDAVHATLPTTAAATSTPHHSGRRRGRITRQIIADAKAPHCPARAVSNASGRNSPPRPRAGNRANAASTRERSTSLNPGDGAPGGPVDRSGHFVKESFTLRPASLTF